jgi:hypothetical protein
MERNRLDTVEREFKLRRLLISSPSLIMNLKTVSQQSSGKYKYIAASIVVLLFVSMEETIFWEDLTEEVLFLFICEIVVSAIRES